MRYHSARTPSSPSPPASHWISRAKSSRVSNAICFHLCFLDYIIICVGERICDRGVWCYLRLLFEGCYTWVKAEVDLLSTTQTLRKTQAALQTARMIPPIGTDRVPIPVMNRPQNGVAAETPRLAAVK